MSCAGDWAQDCSDNDCCLTTRNLSLWASLVNFCFHSILTVWRCIQLHQNHCFPLRPPGTGGFVVTDTWREQVNLAWTTPWFYEPHAIWVIGKKMQVIKISLHIVPQVTSVHRTISSQASQTTWVQHWLHGNKKPGDQLMCFQQCRLPRYQPCSDPESVPVQTEELWGRLQERHFLLYENSFLKVAEYILLSVVISSVIQSIKYLKTAP